MMAKFTVRVELHKSRSSEEYEELHTAMEKMGFSRTIQSDKGKEYYLPTAEYYCEGIFTIDEVRTTARSAANSTGKANVVFVTKGEERVWAGLIEVEQPC
jgi:hypothetical protein